MREFFRVRLCTGVAKQDSRYNVCQVSSTNFFPLDILILTTRRYPITCIELCSTDPTQAKVSINLWPYFCFKNLGSCRTVVKFFSDKWICF